MTVATIIQARMGSTRLPGKTLMDIAGEPLLAHMVARSDAMERSDLTVVATSTSRSRRCQAAASPATNVRRDVVGCAMVGYLVEAGA